MQLTYQATTRLDNLQKQIEFDKNLDGNVKVGYIRGLTEMLTSFINDLPKIYSWNQLPQLLSGFEYAVKLNNEGKSILAAVKPLAYHPAHLLASNIAFTSNPGKQEVKEGLLLKYLADNPNRILKELAKDQDYSFTDSLIKVSARRMPEELFSYAQAAAHTWDKRIRQVAEKDTLTRMIVQLSSQNSGQMYFPFLDYMYKGGITMSDVSQALKDSTDYYSFAGQNRNSVCRTDGKR
jgi:hypothetical protein